MSWLSDFDYENRKRFERAIVKFVEAVATMAAQKAARVEAERKDAKQE